MEYKVVVTDSKGRTFPTHPKYPELKFILLNGLNESNLNILSDADALIVDQVEITKEIIGKLDKCKVIVRMGIGYENVDLDACKNKGIILCNIPDFCIDEVSDHVLAMFFAIGRGIVEYMDKLKNLDWSVKTRTPIRRIKNLTFGILGMGATGSSLALKLKNICNNICFYDPFLRRGFEKSYNVKRVESLDELLKVSDVLSIHVPLTKETLYMVNKEFLLKMKKNAIIINTSRGKIIRLDDLYWALKENIIYGACLDVFEDEPINFEHKLFKAWLNQEEWIKNRLILTPHVAYYSIESEKELQEKAVEEVYRVLSGQKPLNRIV